MKKIILVASSLFLVGAVFTSCKKDYTCACTFDTSTGVTDDMQNFPLGKLKKSDAKTTCKAAETTWAMFGAKCDLK